MSSPLSTLGKNRRAPLPDIQSDGGKKPYKERSDADYEAKLYQEMFPQSQPRSHTDHLPTLRSKVMQKKKGKEGVTSAPSDLELMSSMMQKICQLERKVKTQSVEIEQKARRIAILEEKLNLFQETKAADKSAENQDEGSADLCLKLQNQVREMEDFLNDYGMIWVGSREERDERLNSQCLAVTSGHKSFQMNFDLVIQNIRELNMEAGEGESHVTTFPGGAKLTQQSSIPLWLYKNGIVMFSGPFLSYEEPIAQECMQDLMDGYFPSELQARFPNGVPFQVHDKRDEEFVIRQQWTLFPGRGQTINGARRQSMESFERMSSTAPKPSETPGKKLSMDQFLQRLPETVVRAGKVISIRDSVKAHLQGFHDGAKSHSTITVETLALQASREWDQSHSKQNETHSSKPEKDITTLRVKSEDGLETFIMKMFFTETIKDLRHYLDVNRGLGAVPYDIISAFPRRCYSDDTQTLQSCGLTRNTALLLRPRTSDHTHLQTS